jgi:UDP-N-acetylmuramoylalanine--D-glutamate ligase
VFRPTGFADLAKRRVGIFGYGIEGHATARRLAPLTTDLVLVDDDPSDEGVLTSAEGGLEALATCEVVLKSPGIPRRRADVIALEDRDVTVTSALNLWLHDVDRRRVIAVTGTKGKSTTTSLVCFFLRCLGEEAHELGNIGHPPYDPDLDVSSGWLVLEVSSFQSVDLTVAPGLVLVTSLGSDHLDWHGSLEQYHDDKLSITRASGEHVTLIADEADLEHARPLMGGRVSVAPPDSTGLARELGLLGAHNDHNVGLALAACALVTGHSLDDVRAAVSKRRSEFVALRGRLTLVATLETPAGVIRYVDDGLATAPLPAIAALRVFAGDTLALIAGGFDRGVDYADLAQELRDRRNETTVVVLGPAGERLGAACEGVPVVHAANMDEAVRRAHGALTSGGVVLFSPAAPSFDAYRNWAERSDDFARVVHQILADQ